MFFNYTDTKTTQTINAATAKQSKAKSYLRTKEYAKAIELFEHVLATKLEYINVKPFISVIDIAELCNDLGKAYQALKQTENARKYYHKSWSIYRDEFGNDHPMTRNAQQQCLMVGMSQNTSRSLMSAAAA